MSVRKKSSSKAALAGFRILVGRARHQASALSAELKKLGADVIEIPFIEIRQLRSHAPLDTALKAIAEYDWLILTSVNGVEAVAGRMARLGITAKNLKHITIAAIGPATREEIEKLGLRVAVVPQRYIAESVVESLKGKVEGKRVLLARAKVARDVIPRELRRMGAQVDVFEAYETIVPASSRTRLRSIMKDPKRRPHVVTFTSSSTVRNFAALLGMHVKQLHAGVRPEIRSEGTAGIAPLLEGVQFASIGPITSATLRELGLPVHIEATEYTIPGLTKAIRSAAPKSQI
jgi:uroporphyrinogen-III synthase